MITRAEPVMGTVVSISAVAALEDHSDEALDNALADAAVLLHHDDELFSTWKPESPMSRVRSGELRLEEAPAEIAAVLDLCVSARAMSGGFFDPWALPGGVDPTGLVKGWSAERAAGVLAGSGVRSGMVNAGGDIACFGLPPDGGVWRIGIRHPWRAGALACILEVETSIATSGTYERGSHLFDPIGRRGPAPVSATVTGPSLALADALATAVAVGGDEALALVAELEGYDAYLIRPDGTEASTAGIRFAPSEASLPAGP